MANDLLDEALRKALLRMRERAPTRLTERRTRYAVLREAFLSELRKGGSAWFERRARGHFVKR